MSYWNSTPYSPKTAVVSEATIIHDVFLTIQKELREANSFASLSSNYSHDIYLKNLTYQHLSVHYDMHTYLLSITYQQYGDNNMKFILKYQNQDEDEINTRSLRQKEIFGKELLFYGILRSKLSAFKLFSDLPVLDCWIAQASHVPEVMRLPSCNLFAKTVDILVIRDFNDCGYKVKKTYFDMEHTILAINSVAQLHAISLLLNYNEKLCSMFPAFTKETYYNEEINPDWYNKYRLALKIFTVIGPMMNEEILFPGRDISHVVILMMNDLWKITKKCLEPSTKYSNVLCLMDCNIKSFAFSYDENMKPNHCKIINYENIKYSKPAIDIVQLLYNCSKINYGLILYYILKSYHDTFMTTIYDFHCEDNSLMIPDDLISMDELKESYHECRIVGLARRAIVTSFACMLEEDYPMDMVLFYETPSNLCLATEELLELGEPYFPVYFELQRRAELAFNENPRYCRAMYNSIGALLKCLAETMDCEVKEFKMLEEPDYLMNIGSE